MYDHNIQIFSQQDINKRIITAESSHLSFPWKASCLGFYTWLRPLASDISNGSQISYGLFLKLVFFNLFQLADGLQFFLRGGTGQYIVNFHFLMIGHFLFPFGAIWEVIHDMSMSLFIID